jgi:hypothetical protein
VDAVDLRLQLPGAPEGYLLDALLDAALSAERGGGIFAFATAAGIRAILDDNSFHGLLQAGTLDLVVGVDAITDPPALRELARQTAEHPGLSGRVLLHEESVLFHPKLSWFVTGDTLRLIVGSGNLTLRGLRENWEAFTIVALRGMDAKRTESQIGAWLTRHARLLRSPDDPDVVERATRNTGQEGDLKHPRRSAGKEILPNVAQVLVAEAPKSGSRPSQVNFSKDHYENFFGAKAGTKKRVILYAVSARGAVGEEEIRPSSNRDSRNFSLELHAFRSPPASGAPPVIGVYARLPQGIFLYQRVAPGEAGYVELVGLLGAHWTGRKDHMRRIVFSRAVVEAAWPAAPLWQAEVPST